MSIASDKAAKPRQLRAKIDAIGHVWTDYSPTEEHLLLPSMWMNKFNDMKRKRISRKDANISIAAAMEALENDEGTDHSTLKNILRDNKDLFELAQKRGKTSEDVADLLTKTGLKVSASSLRDAAASVGLAFGPGGKKKQVRASRNLARPDRGNKVIEATPQPTLQMTESSRMAEAEQPDDNSMDWRNP